MGSFAYTAEQVLNDVCKGNNDAALFIFQMLDALHLWDDLIDQDKEPTAEGINAAFWNMLVAIPSNPFYQQNIVTLQAILRLAIANWKAATEYERDPQTPTDLQVAFIIRSTYIDLVTVVAGIIGGPEHAHRISLHVHRICHNEGFEMFLTELQREKAAREERKHGLLRT